jgi:hypothetical protein
MPALHGLVNRFHVAIGVAVAPPSYPFNRRASATAGLARTRSVGSSKKKNPRAVLTRPGASYSLLPHLRLLTQRRGCRGGRAPRCRPSSQNIARDNALGCDIQHINFGFQRKSALWWPACGTRFVETSRALRTPRRPPPYPSIVRVEHGGAKASPPQMGDGI